MYHKSGFNCSKEIGPNIDFKGPESLRQLLSQHDESFIFVIIENQVESYLGSFDIYKRDFDVLDDTLGRA